MNKNPIHPMNSENDALYVVSSKLINGVLNPPVLIKQSNTPII
jgi:hypothetical protein